LGEHLRKLAPIYGFTVSFRKAGGGCFLPGAERLFYKTNLLISSHADEIEKMNEKERLTFVEMLLSKKSEIAKTKLPADIDLVYDGWEICAPLHHGEELTESQYEGAKGAFTEAVKLNPDNSDALNGLGFLSLWHTKELADAERMYKHALEKAAKELDHERVEDVYKCEACKDSMWAATETRPFMRALEGLAWVYYKEGKVEEALNGFKKMVELNPGDNQGARYMIGIVLLKGGISGLLEGGSYQALRFYKLFPKEEMDPSVQFNLALALFLKGKTDKAATCLRSAFFSNLYVAPRLIGMSTFFPLVFEEAKEGMPIVRQKEFEKASRKTIEVIESIKRKEAELKVPISSFFPEALDIRYYSDTEMLGYAEWYCDECDTLWYRYPKAIGLLRKMWYHPRVIEEVRSFIDLRKRLKDDTDSQETEKLRKAEEELTNITRIQTTRWKIAEVLEKKH